MKRWLRNNIGSNKTGFTFAEVLITMALFMSLASVGVGAYFRFYRFSLVNNDASKVIKVLHEARFRAMKNPYNSDYGIHLGSSNSELTVFRETYNPANPENTITFLEQLDITELNLLPNLTVTNDIVFENMTGKTENSGSFTVSKEEFSFTFNINEQGAFE